MRLLRIFLQTAPVILAASAGLLSCVDQPAIHHDKAVADTIFFGQHILTMEEGTPKAEAVAIKGADILFVGKAEDARLYASPETRLVELGDKGPVTRFH